MKTIMTIAMAALCGVLGLQAATTGTPSLVANIPFAFQVGETQMPAGRYTLSPGTPGVLWVRDIAQHATANIQVIPAQPKIAREKAMLVFHKYGERYFLREVWRAGTANGAQIRKTRTERELLQAAVPERVNVFVVAYNK
jgi:hypothetical protein